MATSSKTAMAIFMPVTVRLKCPTRPKIIWAAGG